MGRYIYRKWRAWLHHHSERCAAIRLDVKIGNSLLRAAITVVLFLAKRNRCLIGKKRSLAKFFLNRIRVTMIESTVCSRVFFALKGR